MQKSSSATLIDEFMAATNWENSFLLLDKVCDVLIEAHKSGNTLSSLVVNPAIISKVAEVDSICEKFHARSVIESASANEKLNQYPWLLYDYYRQEVKYLKDNCDRPLNSVACFGHGAIPALALLMLEDNPNLHIDFFDIDPEVSYLAEELVKRINPAANVKFHIADVSSFNSEKTYDVAIITNAPLPYFMQRSEPIKANNLFIRSSTPQGSILYPRIEPDKLQDLGYNVSSYTKDRMYGIHEWIVATRAP